MKSLKKLLSYRTSPLIFVYMLSNQKPIIEEDIIQWFWILQKAPNTVFSNLYHLLSTYPEFRNLFYHRVNRGNKLAKIFSLIFKPLFKGQIALFISTQDIGPGLYLQHAFSTIISAKSIGSNCWINQQVTIGFVLDKIPTLGNNVHVYAGAKVVGGIKVGNNVVIGANAVVVKDVPDNCVVVGNPARIVKRNGIRVNESL